MLHHFRATLLPIVAATTCLGIPAVAAADDGLVKYDAARADRSFVLTCTWQGAAPAGAAAQLALPVDIGADVWTGSLPPHTTKMVQLENFSATLHPPADARAQLTGGAPLATVVAAHHLSLGRMAFDFTGATASGPVAMGLALTGGPERIPPADGPRWGFAGPTPWAADGKPTIKAAYGGLDIQVGTRPIHYTPVPSVFVLRCVPDNDGTLAELPALQGQGPTISRVIGRGFAGLGGVVEVRGEHLGGVRSVTVGGRSAAHLAYGGRVFVLAPPLPAGSHPLRIATANGTAVSSLTYSRLF